MTNVNDTHSNTLLDALGVHSNLSNAVHHSGCNDGDYYQGGDDDCADDCDDGDYQYDGDDDRDDDCDDVDYCGDDDDGDVDNDYDPF